ncbi:uncharacterized protein [Apostichopus japonicus]|uniref:uncharacterized protein n=1 Tax=Stichopus japonicus TaxID=307972 RepID=UPI003AB3FF1C
MGISNSKISKGDRRGSLRGVHPTKPEELVRYGATLIIKSKGRRNRRFVFEEVTDGGIVHSAGIREKDELISVNQIQLNKKSTVESILEIIRGGNLVMLEFRRKLQKETVPFIVMFNVTMEGDYPVIHQFGFYWRTPLSEWKEVLCPLFQRAIVTSCPPIMGDDQCLGKNSWRREGCPSEVRIMYDQTKSLHYLPKHSPKLFLSADSNGKSGIFKMYKYIEQRAPNGEEGVNFVPEDYLSKEIGTSGCNITIGPWNNSPSLPTDALFILKETTSKSYRIKHEDAKGDVTYWTVNGNTIDLGDSAAKASEFKLVSLKNIYPPIF